LLAQKGLIDLFYADETRVSLQGYVPYGWQFYGEDVFVPCGHAKGLNCFGVLAKDNRFHFKTTLSTVGSAFVIEQLETFSFKLERMTVVVLDNARVHRAKALQFRREVWESRGLYLFYLPVYSPELNLIEILWRELKYRWLSPRDFTCEQQLFYSTTLALGAVGHSLRINFSNLI
jgi:transposase